MRRKAIDEHETGHWSQLIRIGTLVAGGMTLLGTLRVVLDWGPDGRRWLVPAMAPAVAQMLAACLPWRRIIQQPYARRLLILWWVAELPVLFLFSLVDKDGAAVYLTGSALLVVLAAALCPPEVVLGLGALSLSGYLALLPLRGHVDIVSAVATFSTTAGVVVISAISARNRRHLDARRKSAQRRTEMLLDNSTDLVLALGEDGRIPYASSAAGPRLGVTSGELTWGTLSSLVHPEDLSRLTEWVSALGSAPEEHTTRIETRIRAADGSWNHFDATGTNRLHDPDVRAVVVSLRDIGLQRALEEELRQQAYTDALTGLPNRASFRERLGHAAGRRDGARMVVLLIDLDDFKNVNDSLGHSAGDELLTVVASRLTALIRPGDTLARLGGDEFALLVEEQDDEESTALAEHLLAGVRPRVRLAGGAEVSCTCSIGMATMDPGDSDQAEQVLRNADLAMYAAKRNGGNASAAFGPAMYAAVLHEVQQRLDLSARS